MLDGDGDGIACEDYDYGVTSDSSDACGDYRSQADAQEAFDAYPVALSYLDEDGDGEACADYRFGLSGRPFHVGQRFRYEFRLGGRVRASGLIRLTTRGPRFVRRGGRFTG